MKYKSSASADVRIVAMYCNISQNHTLFCRHSYLYTTNTIKNTYWGNIHRGHCLTPEWSIKNECVKSFR